MMKTSVILKAAKRSLSKERFQGICSALQYCDGVTGAGQVRVMDMVSDRIEPFAYATDWLAWQIVVGKSSPLKRSRRAREYLQRSNDWLNKQSTAALQKWRHAWLDQMIAEFEAKGD